MPVHCSQLAENTANCHNSRRDRDNAPDPQHGLRETESERERQAYAFGSANALFEDTFFSRDDKRLEGNRILHLGDLDLDHEARI